MNNKERKVITYSYQAFLRDVHVLGDQIRQRGQDDKGWMPDAIFAIARGGLTFGAYLAHRMGVKKVIDIDTFLSSAPRKFTPKAGCTYNYVVVDDISDTGNTLTHHMNALEAKMKEDGVRGDVICATLWIRSTTSRYPDYYVQMCNDDSWIDFPWEGDVERTKLGHFIELLSHKRQVFDPPALVGIQPLLEGKSLHHLQVVEQPEYATVFATPAEAYTMMDTLRTNSSEYQELFAIGLPILSEHVYNAEKNAAYWRTFQPPKKD